MSGGDVGGFGAGSDLVWQLRTGALLQASEKISVSFGYRLMDYDYEDGAGHGEEVDGDQVLTVII